LIRPGGAQEVVGIEEDVVKSSKLGCTVQNMSQQRGDMRVRERETSEELG
jgi:hypothetical protein